MVSPTRIVETPFKVGKWLLDAAFIAPYLVGRDEPWGWRVVLLGTVAFVFVALIVRGENSTGDAIGYGLIAYSGYTWLAYFIGRYKAND